MAGTSTRTHVSDSPQARGVFGVPHRLIDIGFGLSALGWAGRDVVRLGEGTLPLLVAVPLSLMNLLVGVLFLVRRPPVSHAPLGPCVMAAASVLTSGAALSFALSSMNQVALWAFAIAACGAMASLSRLGRSFAILPASRGIEVRGPYRLIRHPAYFFECAMLLAAVVGAGPRAWLVGGVALALMLRRIHDEELILRQDPRYLEYQAEVPYRLIPGVY